ncbi:hypothetical protein ACJRO7_030548 [Eucalyptus globulus]|uniref:Response regulatory domain-containing protein n=1 Tax=Eucalyptus globulus TaxID=34317 RepID=A0ABD3JDY8_EUCGL
MEGVMTPDKNSHVSGEEDDRFPKGLRVLVVDDNVTCLRVLEKMLRDCSYRVTKCQQGEEALSLIRENRSGFDIVLTDVHMPGMDGLQLLTEIANMEITLPVVMFSSDDEKDTVVKGVQSGACDFLVKPIQISTLKILWQHVLRSNPSSRNNFTKELDMLHAVITSTSNDTHPQAENEEENSKTLQRSSEDEGDQSQTKSEAKKPRMVWTPELNRVFIMVVDSLGSDDAKPKKILQIMRKITGVPHLTRQNVSSHLQKYRMNSKKTGEASKHQSAHSSLIDGPGFANPTHSTPLPSSSLIGCGGTQNNAASAQYPSQAMRIAPQGPCTGCSMRMPNPVEFPNNDALPRYQIRLQSQPHAPLQQLNPLLQNFGCQQQRNESAQRFFYASAPSVGFTSPMNNITHPVLPNQSDTSLIVQMSQTPSNRQILDETAAARHYLSTPTHPHPLHGQISTHDSRSLNQSDTSLIVQMSQTPSNMQMLDETAAARHYLSTTTHPHPLHGQISKHDSRSLNSSTPYPTSEQGLPGALSTIGAKVNESCSSNIVPVKGEFSYRNYHNAIAEDCQVYCDEAMFADKLDPNIFKDLGFGEDVPSFGNFIQDNGAI